MTNSSGHIPVVSKAGSGIQRTKHYGWLRRIKNVLLSKSFEQCLDLPSPCPRQMQTPNRGCGTACSVTDGMLDAATNPRTQTTKKTHIIHIRERDHQKYLQGLEKKKSMPRSIVETAQRHEDIYTA